MKKYKSESEGKKQWGVIEAFNVFIQSKHTSLLNSVQCEEVQALNTGSRVNRKEGSNGASPQGLARVVLTADVTVCV